MLVKYLLVSYKGKVMGGDWLVQKEILKDL